MQARWLWAAIVLGSLTSCGAAPGAPAASAAPPAAPGFDIQQPASQLSGEPVAIALHGLAPGGVVELTAERPVQAFSMAGPSHALYRATAQFRVAADGTLDLARAAPLSGTYTGADIRGLFWSMTATEQPITAGWSDDDVHLTASQAGQVAARATLVLRKSDPRVELTPVGPELPGAILARLPGPERRPVVIVLGGSEGNDWTARMMAPRLASHGYAVLGLPYYAPAYGGPARPDLAGLPAAFVDIPVDRLERARDWLRHAPGVDADHIALWGGSKGAEFSLIAATRLAWISAVVAIVPSDVVWEGWGLPDQPAGTRSSFAWRGEPLPFVPYADMAREIAAAAAGKPMQLRRAHVEGRAANPAAVARARIPVEQFHGALLVAGGGADQIWPSSSMTTSIEHTRAAAGLPTTALVFPDAGHALTADGWSPTTLPGVFGGTPAGNARAQAAVWSAMIAFLAHSLPRV